MMMMIMVVVHGASSKQSTSVESSPIAMVRGVVPVRIGAIGAGLPDHAEIRNQK